LGLSLVAAVGGMLSVVLIRRLKPPTPRPTVPASPATSPPAPITAETPATTETPVVRESSEMSKNEETPSE